MIDFAELKDRLEPRLEADLFVQFVEAEGSSLETAVQEAATLLDLPVRRIEYEIVDRGFAGFFGKGVKPWKIKAYARLAEIDEPDDGEEAEVELVDVPEVEVVKTDGRVFVHLEKGDVLLKVMPPEGTGKPATEADARSVLERRQIQRYDEALVRQIVRDAAGKYVRVSGFRHNLAKDSFVRIEISEDEMFAYASVTPPGVGGSDVSVESLKQLLHGNGVVFGIKKDFLVQFTDSPTFGTRVCVAEGNPAVNGADACMEYFFEVDPSTARLKETSSGAVDFKELNIIQNVMVGDKLARKMPPEKGQHGRTVTGTVLPAADGKDIPLPLGENVKLEKDGFTVVADTNGRVVLANGMIGVEKVLVIDGSVGVKTGNIIFLGSVVINGDVEESYSVKATGNIEITGLVEKAEIDSEGDIIVRRGITGKPGISVRAKQTLIAKFIENAVVKCGGTIIVSDGILNSDVSARERVICEGKRAAIIGGKICAGEEIRSKTLGSTTGHATTVCEVGYDPDLKENIAQLTEGQTKILVTFDDLQRNISTLEKMKERQKEFAEDKEEYLAELLQRRVEVVEKIGRLKDQIEQAKAQLAHMEKNGKVSVSAKCYPGTEIIIKDVRTAVRAEYNCVTFSVSNGLVQIDKFVEDDEKSSTRNPRK